MPKQPRRPQDEMDESMGASDATSGGGNASGTPDAETASRTGDTTNRGDVEADRKKLFPESPNRAPDEPADEAHHDDKQ